ncbi:MAG: galactose mutarotase [Flavobacteriales bacterium]|nr:galactose mutarotase [Flavobacteriales bacterium]
MKDSNAGVKHFTLKNKNKTTAIVSSFGARLVSLITPDSKGDLRNVVLGYDSIEDVINGNQYFGATIGRYANRIANAKFNLDGKEYPLLVNNGENSLHGGSLGYDSIVWNADYSVDNKVVFEHFDKDMHEGYPGNISVKVTYELNDENELIISYEALSDKSTPFNITNHAYFNLRGAGNGDILKHQLVINADTFTPLNKNQIPTGEFVNVKGTAFDFLSLTEMGKNIDADDQNILFGSGFDHNWVINGEEDELKFTAKVVEPEFGIVMEVFTTEPGVQFYSANFMGDVGREGVVYEGRSAFCLETQHYPDSPNQPNFPSTILEPGVKFESKSIYKFGIVS